MKNTLTYRIALGLIALPLMFAGCNDGYNTVPVSGTVTLDGEPLAGVEVVYFPMPTEETANVGPFSVGTTDAQGKYTLKTRYDEDGAVIGEHRVTFAYGDVDQEAMADAEAASLEAKGEGEQVSGEEKTAAKQANSQLGKRKRIPKRFGDDSNVKITITAATSDANFDLTSK